MFNTLRAAIAAILLSAAAAHAQSQPYSAFQDRPIKALSADDIAGLRAGRGMAMALPAELNRYPGPTHVLDHESELALTPAQRRALARQIETMRAAATALGERIIAGESLLDALFRSGAADAATIDRLTTDVATLYGQLRAVHLRTHLETRATLTEPQLAKYQALRGYDATGLKPEHKH